ncbi:MAG: 50S ribosomal protein L4 [Tissierellia bacterium]|nr:50S ribosomal protein L4 [Tissierellia bacterium]
MTKVNVLNIAGETVGDIELNDAVFGVEICEHAVYEAVKNYLANQRQGTQSTKTRAEVRGGGRKPWRQKGTGRARQGSIRSPQWRGGGVVFAPKPRDYSYSIPKKVKRLALKSVLTSKVQEEEMIVIEDLSLDSISTKAAIEVLKKLGVDKKAIIVTNGQDNNVYRSFRNIPNVITAVADNMNVYDIINHDVMVITKDAVKVVEEVYA